MLKKIEKRRQRKVRARSGMFGSGERLRLSFHKSNKHVFAQVIDDEKSVTLVSAGDTEVSKKESPKNEDLYFKVGELIAAKSAKKGVKKVILDRGGFRYHGLLKKFAEGARKGGLDF